MRFSRLLALLLLAAPASAQTTGLPGINDLTINGLVSGSTSCTFLNLTGSPMTFQVTTASPGAPVVLLFDTCPCVAGFLPMPTAICSTGIAVFQSLDLMLGPGCFTWTVPGATNALGVFSFSVPACPTPFRFSVQGAILDPFCPPFLLTQAYQVSC